MSGGVSKQTETKGLFEPLPVKQDSGVFISLMLISAEPDRVESFEDILRLENKQTFYEPEVK